MAYHEDIEALYLARQRIAALETKNAELHAEVERLTHSPRRRRANPMENLGLDWLSDTEAALDALAKDSPGRTREELRDVLGVLRAHYRLAQEVRPDRGLHVLRLPHGGGKTEALLGWLMEDEHRVGLFPTAAEAVVAWRRAVARWGAHRAPRRRFVALGQNTPHLGSETRLAIDNLDQVFARLFPGRVELATLTWPEVAP